jgi:hypothetical protein
VTISEWEQIVEDLEELDDIRAYDAAKAGYCLNENSPSRWERNKGLFVQTMRNSIYFG